MAGKITSILVNKTSGNYVIQRAGAAKELRAKGTLTKAQKEWLKDATAGSGTNSNYIYYRKK